MRLTGASALLLAFLFVPPDATAWSWCPEPGHDIRGTHIATSWDEGMPLGNGLLGALIWRQGDALRFSLDRADLWE